MVATISNTPPRQEIAENGVDRTLALVPAMASVPWETIATIGEIGPLAMANIENENLLMSTSISSRPLASPRQIAGARDEPAPLPTITARSARIEDRISLVNSPGKAPIVAASRQASLLATPANRVDPVSESTLVALLRSGTLQRSNRRTPRSAASRIWPR